MTTTIATFKLHSSTGRRMNRRRLRNRSGSNRPLYRSEPLERRCLLVGIASGETVSASLGAPGEIDLYTFDAQWSQSIIFGAAESTPSPLHLHLQLIRPDGTVIKDVSGPIGTGDIFTSVVFAGTYTIRVNDLGSNVGNYNLTMVRVNGPQSETGDDGPLQSGELHTGALEFGDIDVFTIQGTQGESLIARVGETTGTDAEPQFSFHGPFGQLLGSGSGATGATRKFTNLPATGTYYFVLYDQNFDESGTYELTLARTSLSVHADSDSGPIISGRRHAGSISAGDIDIFTMDIPEDGELFWTIAEVVNNPSQSLEVLITNPNGSTFFGGSATETLGRRESNLSGGTYTIFVYTLGQNLDYAMTFVEPTAEQLEDQDSGVATSGEHLGGSLPAGDIDVFTIDVPQGGMLAVSCAEFTWNLTDDFAIYDQTGFLWFDSGIDFHYFHSGFDAGRFTIVVFDDPMMTVNQNYGITIVTNTGTPFIDPDSGYLTDNVQRSGELWPGDLDLYTFFVEAGHTVHTTTIGGPFGALPGLNVFGPDGVSLSPIDGFGSPASVFFEAQITGNHTIVVSNQTNEVNIKFPPAYTITARTYPREIQTDSDSGPVTSGQFNAGVISQNDSDARTIHANEGGSLMVSVGESATYFALQWAVISPSGALLNTGYDSDAAVVIVDQLPETGTYVLVLSATNPASTGDYLFTMVVADGATQQWIDSDSGTLNPGALRTGSLPRGDLDVYTSNLPANTKSFLLAGRPSGAGVINTAVFGPNGNALAIDHPAFTTQEAGTYTIVISNSDNTVTPDYYVRLSTNIDVAALTIPLQQAENRRGDIINGELDFYSIPATAGGNLRIAINESEYLGILNGCEAGLLVLSPSGRVIYTNITSSGIDLKLLDPPDTGSYTLVVFEYGADETLVYGLSALAFDADVVPTGDSGPIVSGETRFGRLDYGDLDVFKFEASVGNFFKASIADLDMGSLSPYLTIIAPDGSEVSASTTNSAMGVTLIRTDLPQSGTYKLLVRDSPGGGTGDYAITMVVEGEPIPTTPDSGPIGYGQSRVGSLTAGDIDSYSFQATSGDAVTFRFGETEANSPFEFRAYVHSASGSTVYNQLISSTSSSTYTLNSSGIYTIHIVSIGKIGSYSLSLNADLSTDNVAPTFSAAEYRYDAVRPRIVFDESEPMDMVSANPTQLVNLTTGQVIDPAELTLDVASSGRFFLSMANPNSVLPDGNYRLTINAGSVSDLTGNALQSDYVSDFFVLAGDVNRDRVVNFNDLLALSQNYDRIGRAFSLGNFNYSNGGEVDFNDLLIVAQRYGTSLPQLRPSSYQSLNPFTQSRRPIGQRLEINP